MGVWRASVFQAGSRGQFLLSGRDEVQSDSTDLRQAAEFFGAAFEESALSS